MVGLFYRNSSIFICLSVGGKITTKSVAIIKIVKRLFLAVKSTKKDIKMLLRVNSIEKITKMMIIEIVIDFKQQ